MTVALSCRRQTVGYTVHKTFLQLFSICSTRFPGDTTLAFAYSTANLLYADKDEYRAIPCESYNFCDIKWFFEDVPYESWSFQTNPVIQYHLEDNNQTLVFESIDCDAQGVYRCEVSNGEITISNETELLIEGKGSGTHTRDHAGGLTASWEGWKREERRSTVSQNDLVTSERRKMIAIT